MSVYVYEVSVVVDESHRDAPKGDKNKFRFSSRDNAIEHAKKLLTPTKLPYSFLLTEIIMDSLLDALKDAYERKQDLAFNFSQTPKFDVNLHDESDADGDANVLAYVDGFVYACAVINRVEIKTLD